MVAVSLLFSVEAISAPVNSPPPNIDSGKIFVRAIRFTGNTQFTSAALNDVLKDSIKKTPVKRPYPRNGAEISEDYLRSSTNETYTINVADVGESYNLAGLKILAARITEHYHIHDFLYSRAIIPAQPIIDGVLVIVVIEGRYSRIKTSGDERYSVQAKLFLNQLQTGEVIHKASLDRMALILADQPGFITTPNLSPGQGLGTADLDIHIARDTSYSGGITLDNHGNLYTGTKRRLLDLTFNSPFLFGDQLKFNTLYTEESLWMAAFNYSLPLGGSGLRANVSYAKANYELGENFASSEMFGSTNIGAAGLSWPVIRSQKANLSILGNYQNKVMNNSENITPSSHTNRTHSFMTSISFDRHDKIWGGGINYGSASWTYGDFTIDSANLATDASTAKTSGRFEKFNLDLFRLQSLPANFTLLTHLSAQWSRKNLDSSEKFGMGGPSGVRAYPVGETFGDEGALLQIEARYTMNSYMPYVFYDTGVLQINHSPWASGNNKRNIAGVGLGLRADFDDFSLNASAAWATLGTFSDINQADNPKLWMEVKYKF